MKARMHIEFDIEVPEARAYDVNAEAEDGWGALTGRPIPCGEVRAYVIEALETWGGQNHPLDPLFRGLKPRNLRLRKR